MPNHVTNKILIHSDKSDEIISFMKSEAFAFDFNNVIPMPESLSVEESSIKDAAFLYVLTNHYKELDLYSAPFRHRQYFGSVFNPFSNWVDEVERSRNHFDKIKSDAEKLKSFQKLGESIIHNYNRYGCSSWAQWCPKNWGTKWNAYDVSITKNSIQFDTAWASPLPITDVLIQKFNLTCTLKAYDEGGNFWFIKEYKDGVLIEERISIEEDAKPLALELKGLDLDSNDYE